MHPVSALLFNIGTLRGISCIHQALQVDWDSSKTQEAWGWVIEASCMNKVGRKCEGGRQLHADAPLGLNQGMHD
jgi:hypothetical protein